MTSPDYLRAVHVGGVPFWARHRLDGDFSPPNESAGETYHMQIGVGDRGDFGN